MTRRPNPSREWMDHAECGGHDVNIFYPHPPRGPVSTSTETYPDRVAFAKSFCDDCPVSTPCLIWALLSDDHHGIFGGTTPQERAHLTRQATA